MARAWKPSRELMGEAKPWPYPTMLPGGEGWSVKEEGGDFLPIWIEGMCHFQQPYFQLKALALSSSIASWPRSLSVHCWPGRSSGFFPGNNLYGEGITSPVLVDI